LLPIGERPVLQILIAALARSGVDRVTLCLGYLAPLVIAFVQSRKDWSVAVDVVIESEPLGTAAPLRLIKDLPEHTLVINGDTITDLDFAAMAGVHRARAASVTIFSPRIEERLDYGLLEIEAGSDRVRGYIEKPVRAFDVSSGVYVVARAALRYLPPAGRFDMPELIGCVLAAGEAVVAYRPTGVYWRDIGRQDHFEAANRDMTEFPERFAR
jgi:mannose-1-phosphate guanylyltransferase